MRLSVLLFLLGIPLVAATAPVDVALRDLDGNLHNFSEFRGRWVVVNYWATWCPPCRSEIPELIFFHDAHKDKDAVVVGVNYEAAPVKDVKAFLEEYMVNYTILVSDPDDGSALGNVQGLPTTFLMNPKGEVVYSHMGMVNQKSLEAMLAKFKSKGTHKDKESRK